MRKLPIATVAAVALMAASASAQMTPSPAQPRTPGSTPATAAAQPSRPAPNPLAQEDISKIEGTAVYGNDDKKIGRISTVLMDPQSKKVEKLVVNAGGVLGVGGHRVAIPVDQFSWDGQKDAFRLSTTETALKDQPEWVEGEGTMSGSSIPPKDQSAPTNDAGK
ncbi:MAG TPA: PRC-barrel domain-containing protein [Stellaceae bacterium]|jgi:sporulation protein YlmC with PRC-barrel domain|nr:PRC-barrel domain-containing protein [Stellaceae bacterium]